MLDLNQIYVGDNLELLKLIDTQSVDMHLHSPPYAKMKQYKSFSGIEPDNYVDWFMPRILEIERTLKDTGVWILNINDCVVDGFRHSYVFDLISATYKNTGLKLIERLAWNKGKSLCHPKKFRDPFEYIFIFGKSKNYYMDIDAMRLPYNKISLARMKHPIKKRFARTESNQDSNDKKDWAPNPLGALPSTILSIGSESKRQSNIHTAVFPERLVEYFVKGFSKENDVVVDIFSGAGTTATVAKRLGRNYIGFEMIEDYAIESRIRISQG